MSRKVLIQVRRRWSKSAGSYAHVLIGTRRIKGDNVGTKIRGHLSGFAGKEGSGGFLSDKSRWFERWSGFQND